MIYSTRGRQPKVYRLPPACIALNGILLLYVCGGTRVLPAVFFQDGILREKQGFGRLLIQDAEPDFQQIVAYGAGSMGEKAPSSKVAS